MPVTSSGAVTLDEIHVEAGGSTGSSCTINDADIRALIDKSDGATMAFNEWYGATASLDQDSGTATSFGINSTNFKYISTTFDSNSNKVVIVYYYLNKAYAIVATPAADLSITFGSAVQIDSTNIEYAGTMDVVFDSNSNKVVVIYGLGGASSYGGRAIVGTVSGTSISFGSAATWGFKSGQGIRPVFDSNSNKVVVFAEDGSPGVDAAKAVVGTVSSTDISFGTPVQVGSAAENISSGSSGAVFDSNSNKAIYFFKDVSDSNKGKAIVGTVSGTSISFGSLATFDSGTMNNFSRKGAFDTNVNKVVYSYDTSSDGTKAVVGTVSGTSISFGSPITVNSSGIDNYVHSTFDSNLNKVVIAFKDNSKEGRAIVFQNAD